MDLKRLLPKEHVLCSINATTRRELLAEMTDILVQEGTVTDKECFLDAVEAREDAMTTQTDGGIAFPHASSAAVRRLALVVAMLPEPGFHYDKDQPSPCRLFFLIAIPLAAPAAHLPLLTHLAEIAMAKNRLEKIFSAETPAAIHKLLLSAPSSR
jgi:mannitol/fructose-specific phosphotransferase system IIA component (Ntr-type)